MKKVYLGLFVTAFVLGGCGSSTDSASGSTTESSLRAEVSKLEEQNKELNERVETFEKLVEGFTTESSESFDEELPETSVSVFKLGESAEFSDGEKITVTEVRADDALTLNEKQDGEHPVVVTATIENVTTAPISFNCQVFDLYDGNDELARFDASTYSNNIPHEIAAGKKATVVMHFGSKQGAPYSVAYGEATWTTN